MLRDNHADECLCVLTSEDLVEEDLDVVGAEMLRTDDNLVQIAL